jgi:hypothetical protein
MTQFGIGIEFDKKQVQRWQSRFESEIPGAFAGAHKWTVDEIAKAAVTGFRQNAHRHIDRPNAWMLTRILEVSPRGTPADEVNVPCGAAGDEALDVLLSPLPALPLPHDFFVRLHPVCELLDLGDHRHQLLLADHDLGPAPPGWRVPQIQ